MVLILGGFLIEHMRKAEAVKLTASSAAKEIKLFETQDKPWPILIKEVDVENGKAANLGVTIHQSKSRYNQMKEAILAFLHGPRIGKLQVPVPGGVELNEFYLTRDGFAVVDLSLSNVKKEEFGFYEETLFVRGLIEALSRNFFEVKQVKILADGQDTPTLCGHYALGATEAASPAMVPGVKVH